MSHNLSRLSRLTAILLKLQTRPYVAVKKLAEEFDVSIRTIYRDLSSLEESGVPLVSLESKGYTLIDGFNIPPVMFSESEAQAIIMAEQIIARTKDESLIQAFQGAAEKIRSVLQFTEREKADFLASRTIIGKNWEGTTNSSFLTDIQSALTNFQVLELNYQKEGANTSTQRQVEPFAIYHNPAEQWVLIAWCRLRNDFRNFRLDRIQELTKLDQHFTPHSMSLEEYVEIQKKKHFSQES